LLPFKIVDSLTKHINTICLRGCMDGRRAPGRANARTNLGSYIPILDYYIGY
jgi:hypothetical protein